MSEIKGARRALHLHAKRVCVYERANERYESVLCTEILLENF